jgi:multidrug resistance efflux pump
MATSTSTPDAPARSAPPDDREHGAREHGDGAATTPPSIWSWRRAHDTGANDDAYGSLRGLHSSSLQAASTPHMARAMMIGSVIALTTLTLILFFVPWRQTVSGSGEITAFSPNARPQKVESQIKARIREWYVVEGDTVAAGDELVALEDISTSYMDNRFVERIAANRESELAALRFDVSMAEQKLSQARQKLRAARAKVENANIAAATARVRYERVEALYADGLSSLRSFETEQLKLQKAMADSISASADLEAAQQGVESARLDVSGKESKLEAKAADLDLKLDNARERQAASVVRAPVSGVIARVARAGPGETVKENGELALIVPTTGDQAAEIFVNGMDAAIVEPGRRVQLQFSGFPALQFSGFPGASIGTFSGVVRVIDPVDTGAGNYRILIVPDTTSSRPPWPDPSYLRQGSRVTGWVLLSDVPLGYEIWRRMNGLPPMIPVRDKQYKRKPK